MSAPVAQALLSAPAERAGLPWWTLVLIGLVGVTVGVIGGYAIAGRRRSPADPPASTLPGPSPASTLADLDLIIESVIEARDLAQPSTVMTRRLGEALAHAGVREFTPVGAPYDPTRHYAVGTEPAPDAASADLIAEVQRVGYLRDSAVIRAAEVVVFRLEPAR